MHILVTGANGQLGSEIKHLANQYSVYHFSFIDINDCDLTNESDVQSYFAKNHFDIIINCAAYTAFDKAESDIKSARALNSEAPKYLAKAASLQGAKLIHISTDYVFNGEQCRPYKEEDTPLPSGIYGQTKYEGENNILSILPNDALIIRTAWLYSPYGFNFLKTMMRLGESRDEISVVNDQVGSPTYARDLARAILDICANLNIHKSEIYHFSNEGICSWYDFAIAIMEEAKLSCRVLPISSSAYKTPNKRPLYSVLSKEKAKLHFKNIKIPYWRDSLKECISVIKEEVYVPA